MREMKDSGMPWIGKIPKNWRTSPIKYICKPNSIKIGPFGSALANKTFANEKYNVYGQANLVSGNFSATKNTVTKKTFNDLRNYEVLPDDICVSMMGTIGKCRIVPLGIKQGIMDSHLIKLRVKNEVILPEFFLYVYDKDLGGVCFKQMQYEKTGSIMDGLNTSIVKRLYVTLPPVKEQHRITDYLDSKCAKIDSIKKNVEAEIEALKQYKKSVITEAVTKGLDKHAEMKDSEIPWIGKIPKNWEISRLKYILKEPMKYGANESGVAYSDALPRYIRITDINSEGKLRKDGKVSLNEDIAKRYILKDKSILFARSGGTVGKTFFYRKEYGTAAFAGYLISAVIDEDKALPEWIYYYVNSSTYWEWVNQIYTQSTIQNIGADKYSEMSIPICPNISLQKNILKLLDSKCAKIDSIIQKKQELLTNLDTYKKSLIYECVTGKKEVPAV